MLERLVLQDQVGGERFQLGMKILCKLVHANSQCTI